MERPSARSLFRFVAVMVVVLGFVTLGLVVLDASLFGAEEKEKEVEIKVEKEKPGEDEEEEAPEANEPDTWIFDLRKDRRGDLYRNWDNTRRQMDEMMRRMMREMEEMERQMGRRDWFAPFQRPGGGWFGPGGTRVWIGPRGAIGGDVFSIRSDVRETDKAYVVTCDVPGVEKTDVNVTVEDRVLTIKAERKVEKESKDEQGKVVVQERSYGSFVRSFALPEDADEEKIAAKYDNGVLTVTIPKGEKPKKDVRHIDISLR